MEWAVLKVEKKTNYHDAEFKWKAVSYLLFLWRSKSLGGAYDFSFSFWMKTNKQTKKLCSQKFKFKFPPHQASQMYYFSWIKIIIITTIVAGSIRFNKITG